MHLKKLAGFLVVLVSTLLLFGCGKKGGDTIKIGVITSLTGPQAAFGGAHKNGYAIALDEINAKGGVLGKKIELDIYDDQSKTDQAVQGVSKLVDQDGVTILLGAYSSENTKSIINPVIQHQVPLIIPTATADNVMDSKSPWIFRVCAGATEYARATIAFLKDNGAPKTMAIVYENTNFGQDNKRAMEEAAKQAGIKVVDIESYEARSPDYKAVLQRVKQTNPDVIYFCSYLLDATTLMRQAQEIDLNPKYYTAAGTGFAAAEFPTPNKGAGKNAEYTFSVSQWLPEAPWPGSKEFDAEYFKRTNTHPQYHAMQAYAALMTIAEAIKNANSTDSDKVRDALKNLNMPSTPFGPIRFDNGQNQHRVLETQVQGGKYHVVYPPESADAKPVIPAPKWSERK